MSNRLLIWNEKAGKAAPPSRLLERLKSKSANVLKMTRETDLRVAIRNATSEGCEVVVAAGGDGTVNATVNALMYLEPAHRPRLCILPMGTANDFAGTLCIPDAIDDAIELLDTTQYRPIDIVRIRASNFERYFANVAAGGNSVRVSEEITEEAKARWGAFCYLRGALEVLSDLKSYCVTADIDDERFEDLGTWAVLIANGKTNAGRIVVAPQASPVDGLLDVILIRNGTGLDIVEIVSKAITGNYLECDQVIFRQAKRLRLHSRPGMRFTLDGEQIEQEPVQFEVVPGAIQMYVGVEFLSRYPAGMMESNAQGFGAAGTQNP